MGQNEPFALLRMPRFVYLADYRWNWANPNFRTA